MPRNRVELRGLAFLSKAEIRCFYKGRELKKRYIPDLFVFGCLVVELKAVAELAPEHEAQLMTTGASPGNRSGTW